MKVTSVTGHIKNYEFDQKFKGWYSVPPEALITEAIIHKLPNKEKTNLVKNLEQLS